MLRSAPDDRLLSRLRWPLRHAVMGVDPGSWRSVRGGDGLEISTVREYVPGDDVRRINWTASARTGTLQSIVPVAERALDSRIVVDLSGSMAYGSIISKHRLATEAAETLNRIASRHSDRVQIVTVGGAVLTGAPRQGRMAVLSGQSILERSLPDGKGPFAQVLTENGGRRSGLVIAVSDFRDEEDRRALQQTARLGATIAVIVSDPHEHQLPDVGLITVADPESGERMTVDTSDRNIRQRFTERAALLRQEILQAAAGCVLVCEISTGGAHGGVQIVSALLRKGARRR